MPSLHTLEHDHHRKLKRSNQHATAATPTRSREEGARGNKRNPSPPCWRRCSHPRRSGAIAAATMCLSSCRTRVFRFGTSDLICFPLGPDSLPRLPPGCALLSSCQGHTTSCVDFLLTPNYTTCYSLHV